MYSSKIRNVFQSIEIRSYARSKNHSIDSTETKNVQILNYFLHLKIQFLNETEMVHKKHFAGTSVSPMVLTKKAIDT